MDLMKHPEVLKNKHYTFENSLINTIKDGRIISKLDKNSDDKEARGRQGKSFRV